MFKSVRSRLVSTLLLAATALAAISTILVSNYVQKDLERGAIESQNSFLIDLFEEPELFEEPAAFEAEVTEDSEAGEAFRVFEEALAAENGDSLPATISDAEDFICGNLASCLEMIEAIDAAEQLLDNTPPTARRLSAEESQAFEQFSIALTGIATLHHEGSHDKVQSALGLERGESFFLADTFVGTYLEVDLTKGSINRQRDLRPTATDVVVPIDSFLGVTDFGLRERRLNQRDDATFASATFDFEDQSITLLGDVSAARQAGNRLRQLLVVGSGIFVALAGAASWYLTGRALRPVSLITKQVSGITSRSINERVPQTGTGDEIDQLAVTMNGMLQRLEAGDTKRRQFISDAAHELRTPVAVIMSEAEVAQKQKSTTENQRFASAILSESLRMDAIVEDLLTLARFDEHGSATNQRNTDLDELVLEQAARTRQLPVDIKAVSAGRVAGPSDELDRVVAHVLDNAARHGRSQVAIGVSTDDETQTVELWVDDDGLGVDPEHREKIFERFTRLQESRDRDSGGAGLGLAVVAATVEGLGGNVQVVESPDLGGARFVLKFPASTA